MFAFTAATVGTKFQQVKIPFNYIKGQDKINDQVNQGPSAHATLRTPAAPKQELLRTCLLLKRSTNRQQGGEFPLLWDAVSREVDQYVSLAHPAAKIHSTISHCKPFY